MEVPLGDEDGTVMTLGELKDYARAQRSAEAETASARSSLASREATIQRDRELLALTLQEVGGKVPLSPALRERIERTRVEHEQKQQYMMHAVLPELQDGAELARFRSELVKRMAKYSFEPHDLNITDYRIVWALKDLMGKADRLEALEGARPRHKEPKTIKPQGKAPVVDPARAAARRARGGDNIAKASAISALLKSRR